MEDVGENNHNSNYFFAKCFEVEQKLYHRGWIIGAAICSTKIKLENNNTVGGGPPSSACLILARLSSQSVLLNSVVVQELL